MTSWPEAIGWSVIAVCCLLAWVAWLRYGNDASKGTDG